MLRKYKMKYEEYMSDVKHIFFAVQLTLKSVVTSIDLLSLIYKLVDTNKRTKGIFLNFIE